MPRQRSTLSNAIAAARAAGILCTPSMQSPLRRFMARLPQAVRLPLFAAEDMHMQSFAMLEATTWYHCMRCTEGTHSCGTALSCSFWGLVKYFTY